MIVKYKQNKPLSSARRRFRTSLRFELVETKEDKAKLKGKTENGTPWFEWAHIDEIEET